jgi:hypothetical protein
MVLLGLGYRVVILAHDSSILSRVQFTHGLTGTGNTVPYPYPHYPLGKALFPITYPWVKKISHTLVLIGFLPIGFRVSGKNCHLWSE